MAIIKDTSFESDLAAEGFYSTSVLPPSINTARPKHLSQALRSDISLGPSEPEGWARWLFPVPPLTASFRMYVNFDAWEPNFEETFAFVTEPLGINYFLWRAKDTAGVLSINPSFSVGVHDLTSQVISYDTYYRLEWLLNVSATGWTCTWGYALGDAALTTINTASTGGNTFAPATLDYFHIGCDSYAACVVYYDAVKFFSGGSAAAPPTYGTDNYGEQEYGGNPAGAEAPYPIGPVAPLDVARLRLVSSPLRW